MMKLILVPFDEAVDGERYITKMKHGWIEGYWNKDEETCHGYYWRSMEWYPIALYKLEEEV